jgi:hypothetical protein
MIGSPACARVDADSPSPAVWSPSTHSRVPPDSAAAGAPAVQKHSLASPSEASPVAGSVQPIHRISEATSPAVESHHARLELATDEAFAALERTEGEVMRLLGLKPCRGIPTFQRRAVFVGLTVTEVPCDEAPEGG